MKFHILGPLEVIGDAGPVHLAAPALRSLLLALLSHPNDVVSVDRLQEWLWPDGAPRSAPAAMQARVSILRRLLEPDREPWSKPRLLLTSSPGYVLHVGPGELDSLMFESLLQRGRAARDAGDPARVYALLREALGLWRGDALTDVAFLESAQPVIRRLEELRLTALDLRAEAELQLGRHQDIIPDLMVLVSTYPVHEPFYAHLMLALYRCGRRADALGVYAQLEDVLAKEMALQPGSALRWLRRAIETDDGTAPVRPR